MRTRRWLRLDTLESRLALSGYTALPLGVGTFPEDINASAQVVGYHYPDGAPRAFLWNVGSLINLGTLGGAFSYAYAINDVGQVVGGSAPPGSTEPHAFLLTPEDIDADGSPDRWFRDSDADGDNDLMRDLGTLGGNYSAALDINSAGQVVGYSYNGATDALGFPVFRPFLWQGGAMADLGTQPGTTHGSAAAINAAGQVAGSSFNYNEPQRVTLWRDGTVVDLGTTANQAQEINTAGQILARSSHLWTPSGTGGAFAPLPPLPGEDYATLYGLNDAGLVVGTSTRVVYYEEYQYSYEIRMPVLWENGVPRDLNAEIENGTVEVAHAVNNAGQIVATTFYYDSFTGQFVSQGFLLTKTSLGVPLARIDDVTVTEGNTGTTEAVFTVTLSEASSRPVTVRYATRDLSATAGSDYVTASGTLTFAPGVTSLTVPVTVLGDRAPDFTEQFTIQLDGATNAILMRATGFGVIHDDEPVIVVNPVTVTEGNVGTTPAAFTVLLLAPYDIPVSVDYFTSDGYYAAAGSDYVAASGTLTFAPGETSKTVEVGVIGDRVAETFLDYDYGVYHEFFYFNLSNATAPAVIAFPSVTATVFDDEPILTVEQYKVAAEGNGGTTTTLVTVTLSAPYDQDVTVSYNTIDGSARAGLDYVATSGTLTFAPGQTSLAVAIDVLGDRLAEGYESFTLHLHTPSANSMFLDSAYSVIEVADDEPTVSVDPYWYLTADEGNSGTRPVSIPLKLSAPYDQPVTVSWATADGAAKAGLDYIAASGSVTFAPGQTSGPTITVFVKGDTKYEGDEDFLVRLTPGGNALADYPGYTQVVILNDEPPPTASIGDVTKQEGNNNTTNFVFTVSLSFASFEWVYVYYATEDGTATLADNDYREPSGYYVAFAPGQTSKTLTIKVNGDRRAEANERFFVRLTDSYGADVADGEGVGTIVNDDRATSRSSSYSAAAIDLAVLEARRRGGRRG